MSKVSNKKTRVQPDAGPNKPHKTGSENVGVKVLVEKERGVFSTRTTLRRKKGWIVEMCRRIYEFFILRLAPQGSPNPFP